MSSNLPLVAAAGGSTVSAATEKPRRESRRVARLRKQKSTLFWASVLLIVVVTAILAPLIAPYGPEEGDLLRGLEYPSAEHLLGTDALGRDTLTRLLFGARVALLAGLEAVLIATLVGIPLGLISGYIGGRLDWVLMRIAEGVMSIPFLVLAIALIGVVGPGLFKSMAIVGVVFGLTMLRLTRGEAIAAREELYVDGAKVAGAKAPRIIFQHIFPNIVPPLIVQATLMFATAVLIEAVLSYLGLGVQSPTPSWGGMLFEAQQTIRENFFFALPPGIAIIVVVLAINQIGDGLRDLFAREAKGGSLGVSSVVQTPAEESLVETGCREDSDPLLRVRGLNVTFPSPDGGRMTVVQDVTLDVGRGEIVALVGESGSGKSVSALSILGLVSDPGCVEAATICLDGEELTERSFKEMRRIRGNDLGVVFQEPMASLNPAFTVGDQMVEIIREHKSVSKKEARELAVEWFDLVGITRPTERLGAYPHQFSGGMAQRVMIAMALVCEPKMLIADEPTTALDVTVQGQILDLLSDIRERTGLSILLITHDLGVVADIADRAVVMYAGQIIESGSTRELFDAPEHPYTEGLIASTPRNVKRSGRLHYIPGVVPPPHKWPEGCHFADRCGYARDLCTTGPISLGMPGEATPSRSVRCIRSSEIVLDGVKKISHRNPLQSAMASSSPGSSEEHV